MATSRTKGFRLDRKLAVDLVMKIMKIPGPSGEEGRIVEFITGKLREAGVPASAIKTDSAHRRSPKGGQIGNLVVKLPGTVQGPRRMLMAHMDTVPICVGSKPVRRGKVVRSSDARTGLGADDRAGTATVLTTALEILRCKLPHPPLTLLWTVQEEGGLNGARYASLSLLGRPKMAFNFDGGTANKLTIGATGAYRLRIEISGLATHAGLQPEQGVSAIAIAGLAIARLVQAGYHGRIEKDGHRGTSNIGVIRGGQATNVVTDTLLLEAEVRSHDPQFRREVLEEFHKAFEAAAAAVQSQSGKRGKVRIIGRLDYEAFELERNDPCVQVASAAVRWSNAEPIYSVTNGGVDANWMNARGIPTVTLGAGQRNPHTVQETLDLAEFERACRIALRLATT